MVSSSPKSGVEVLPRPQAGGKTTSDPLGQGIVTAV